MIAGLDRNEDRDAKANFFRIYDGHATGDNAVGFQPLQLHAHRSLSARQPVGGAADRAGLGHGDQGAQQPYVDVPLHKHP